MSRGVESFEDNILTNISTATGDDFGADDVIETEVEETSPVPKTKEPSQEEVDQSLTEQTRPKEQAPKEQKPRTDAQGNVVDDKGNVVARAGAERRLHLRNERLSDELRQNQERVKNLETELQAAKSYGDLPQRLGLKPDQVADAFELTARFQKDPVSVIKELMARALAGGVEMRQIVDDEFIPNLSLRANAVLMEQGLKPARDLLESQKTSQEETARAEQARSEALRFMDDFADQGAEVHAQDIAIRLQEIRQAASRQGRQLDSYSAAQMALTEIRNFCFEHGLDPMQPIQAQIEARKQPNGRGRSAPTPQSRRPMPNGSGRGTATEQVSTFANPSDDYSSIVRSVMRESGFDV